MKDAETALAPYGVSRETRERLEVLAALLAKWNPKINLVARGTVEKVWTRHIADSAQLYALAPQDARTWVDLGSGGGFPGLVIGAMAAEKNPGLQLSLVESDVRKCAFLSTAAGEMGLKIKVATKRIEALEPGPRDVVSARALASLTRLLDFAEPLVGPGTICLFPKGAGAAEELTEAAAAWHIRHRAHPSRTDPDAVILEIQEFSRGPLHRT
ncbi:16S rRNA (guanine(527)-N(7))-methyltransferase RsmG [Albimonas sp. CAU 1670]|uniref:16S rRNA (guanine(527)-N(7))-methyltransferase RsmG n=1 Tax=Albimonas sp. CAU 1670 TaxID=3032599 RepID=UPI0023D990C6|nr:16S rRNA (guanine(527)-N(7))-methyltransferase RsmG [Albimonas sp. CAU 1670]MDF2231185.1 16S rRNA (guanine(527)-N(7))-methyltransferase RsmG [Albimonas sp. CAU 1670]